MTNSSKQDERVEQLHQDLEGSIKSLVTSEDWMRSLETASKFHQYSYGNALLILFQKEDATRVAGYKTWQTLGRQVRKGETGIRILAPMTYKREVEKDDGTTETVRGIRGWRTVSVFDIGQTDGEPLDTIEPEWVQGDKNAPLWDALAAQVEAAGFTLESERPELVSANGVTDHAAKTVKVRPDIPGAAQTKTLAHELAHVMLHSGSLNDGTSRDIKEVEAESVAYIVCNAAGLATDSYSFPYVAIWAKGDTDLVAKTGQRVMQTAKKILEGLSWGSVDIREAKT